MWAVAIVILFQSELRRFLIHFGNSPLLRRLFPIRPTLVVEEIARAAVDLSQRQYGGLFVITREVGLRAVDGAAVITGGLVVAAKCILPLSNAPLDGLGTRHRAALGISEECDAVVVVVSEGTGQMRVAEGGKLTPVTDEAHILETLRRLLGKEGARQPLPDAAPAS